VLNSEEKLRRKRECARLYSAKKRAENPEAVNAYQRKNGKIILKPLENAISVTTSLKLGKNIIASANIN
jgi:hypothetical protein